MRAADGAFLGTAFFTSRTQVLTCQHVIERADVEVRVRWLGESRNVRSVRSGRRDAALVELAEPFTAVHPRVLQWADRPAALGERIVIAGFNDPREYNLEHLGRELRGFAEHFNLGILDHPVLDGFSGSPALVANAVIGMVVAADPDRTFVIPVGELDDLRPRSPLGQSSLLVDIGVVREKVSPSGRAPFAEFTLTNRGRTDLKITSIALRVDERVDISTPHHFVPEGLPEQFELLAELEDGRDDYELLDGHHVLVPGETEGYRLRLQSPEGRRYRLLLLVSWRQLGADERHTERIGPIAAEFPLQSTQALLDAVRDARQRERDAGT